MAKKQWNVNVEAKPHIVEVGIRCVKPVPENIIVRCLPL